MTRGKGSQVYNSHRMTEREERLEAALYKIAALNDLDGVQDDQVEAFARGNLHQCELIAREALEE